MDTFWKRVSRKEYKIHTLASEHNVSPKIIEYKNRAIHIPKYKTWYEVPGAVKSNPITHHQLFSKLNTLYCLGIMWLNVREDYIVFEPNTMEPFLINFSTSEFFKDLKISKNLSENKDLLYNQERKHLEYVLRLRKDLPSKVI